MAAISGVKYDRQPNTPIAKQLSLFSDRGGQTESKRERERERERDGETESGTEGEGMYVEK